MVAEIDYFCVFCEEQKKSTQMPQRFPRKNRKRLFDASDCDTSNPLAETNNIEYATTYRTVCYKNMSLVKKSTINNQQSTINNR